MKRIALQTLDLFIPSDILEFEQREELIRARAIVFLLLLSLFTALLILFVVSVSGGWMSPQLRLVMPYTVGISVVGFGIALWAFHRHGLFLVSGNLYALICFCSVVVTASKIADYRPLMLILLAVPVLVSLVANHLSARLWLLLIAAAPAMLDPSAIAFHGEYFIYGWLTCCSGLFLALEMENFYQQNMLGRLNVERMQFEFAAAHDPLTGLANRATFDRRLQESVECCALNDCKSALLYIDLDKFKAINDTYGHQAGDIVLTTVAARLRQLVRRSDTVARLGGDEFAILFPQCDPDGVRPYVVRVLEAVRKPIEVFGNHLMVDGSVGMVVCPDDGLHPDQLAHKADERMYADKRTGPVAATPLDKRGNSAAY